MARVIRANHDTAVFISRPPVIKQALSKLSKPSLAALALAWLDDPNLHPVAQKRKRQRLNDERDSDDSEESEDEEELEEDLKELYEGIRDDAGVSRTKLVETMVGHWNRGLTFRQVAQIDVQYLKDKPTSRSWTAYQLQHTHATPKYTNPTQLFSRLRTALSPYHDHHLYLDSSPTLTTLRLQLLPTSPLLPTPPALLLLHLPQAPFLLLPTLPSALLPILLQCLCTALSTPPAKSAHEIQLKGKDWRGLREVLLGRMSSGGMTKWREGRGEGGGPLVTEERRVVVDDSKGEDYVDEVDKDRIVKDDAHLQVERGEETGAVFGREALPVLEWLDYEISLPYPNNPADDPSPEPFLVRFEGAHVLRGLRVAAEKGFADDGFPAWIGQVAREGRNALRVGKAAEG